MGNLSSNKGLFMLEFHIDILAVYVLSNMSCFLFQEVKGAGAGLTAAILLAMVNFSTSFVT